MKDKDLLRLEQIEDSLGPYRGLLRLQPPHRGWIRAIREALGMSSQQLARRAGLKASQSIEDMQQYEMSGTIKLQTLHKLAEAMDCRLVYALVPRKPLLAIRRDRARLVARRMLKPVSHSMTLEEQGVSEKMEQRQLDRQVEKLLAGDPRSLWD